MKRSDGDTLYIQLHLSEPLILISGSYTIEHYLDIQTGNAHDTMENPEILTFDREGALTIPVEVEDSIAVPDWLKHQLPANQLLGGQYPERFAAAYWGTLLLFVRNGEGQSDRLQLKDVLIAQALNGTETSWCIGGGGGQYKPQNGCFQYFTEDQYRKDWMVQLALKGQKRDQLYFTNLIASKA